jgi:predicted glutamine amidotransferase
MCRLLAYVSPTPKTAHEVLGSAQMRRFAALSDVHCHGWGAAWASRPGDAVERHRDLREVRDDPAFSTLTGRLPVTAMGLHLRWAVGSAVVAEDNNHPFARNGVALMHNGTISPRQRLDAMLEPETLASVTGTTDSERYLALIAERRRESTDLAAAVTATVAQLRIEFPHASLNAVVLDGAQLVVVHVNSNAALPLEELQARGRTTPLPDGHDTGYYRMSWRTELDGTVLVTSSGLDTDGWTVLPADSITSVELATGGTCQTRLPQEVAA